jgi:hypothetical protein
MVLAYCFGLLCFLLKMLTTVRSGDTDAIATFLELELPFRIGNGPCSWRTFSMLLSEIGSHDIAVWPSPTY